MQKNEEIILNITDVTSDGNGIGKHNGMAVFVPLTAIGDECLVKILKVKKNYVFGKFWKLLSHQTSVLSPTAQFLINAAVVFTGTLTIVQNLKLNKTRFTRLLNVSAELIFCRNLFYQMEILTAIETRLNSLLI